MLSVERKMVVGECLLRNKIMSCILDVVDYELR